MQGIISYFQTSATSLEQWRHGDMVVSTSAGDWLERLVSELTFNMLMGTLNLQNVEKLDLCFVAASGTRATDHFFHPLLPWAAMSVFLQPAAPVSGSRSFLQVFVFLGCPFLLWPCNVHCSACLAVVSFLSRVSAVFAIRQCPSVCHVAVFYPTAADIVKLLYGPSSPITSFVTTCADTHRGGKNLWFSTETWKQYEIGPWLLWNVNRLKVIGGRLIPVGSNDLEWPWKAGCHGSNFSGGSP